MMFHVTRETITYVNILIKYCNGIRYSHMWSSRNTRQQFLDYFLIKNDHNFIRSSPVVPFCDPTVAFVNAGMNQFKEVFLGRQDAVFSKVANSQKCIRVGGKHNDLSVVGTDGYHHTFFEMLGNWSFGDYFKKEACELALHLLTGPYRIPPTALYVTYFAGDPVLHLDPDLECKDIWRRIGVAEDHIIPFGVKENFWEMGLTGPCGPCSEIHIDHKMSTKNRRKDVNKNLPDLTELWNIVFIQYNRDENGNITLLPKKHIDTGMGLERLTAILQKKSSNYDTDIFESLFNVIQKNCSGLPHYGGKFGLNDDNKIDTSYRILADHARMIIVCLADGMIPEQNQKLRKIIRKSLHLSETIFKKKKGLLNELALAIGDNLGETYPEIINNMKQVQEIILFEEEIYKSIRQTASIEWANIIIKEPRLKSLNVIEMPGLITAYNDICSSQAKAITSDLAFRLYDTHGLDEETIVKLSHILNLPFETMQLKSELENARNRTKQRNFSNNNFTKIVEMLTETSKTDDTAKYDYKILGKAYTFKSLETNILHIIKNNKLVEKIDPNEECFLILDKTNLYTESGGQTSDTGIIKFSSEVEFKITDVLNINGYIFHKGKLKSGSSLTTGTSGTLYIDTDSRLKTMANHTATHLLNAAIKKISKASSCQKSSSVLSDYLTFDVGVYSSKLSMDSVQEIETLIRDSIKSSIPVDTKLINSQQLLNTDNITVVPGEVYPNEGIRLITIEDKRSGLFSCEPCCGTHVLNTSDIQDICITNYRSLGRSTVSLTAVTRDRATWAHKNGQKLLKKVMKFHKNEVKNDELRDINDTIVEMRHRLKHGNEDEDIMPIYVKSTCMDILNEATRKLREIERMHLKDLINLEMKTVLESNQLKTKNDQPFIVHFLGFSSMLDNVPLQHATKICTDVPVIVVSYSENVVKARCCVPKSCLSSNFNAELWLKTTIADIFKCSYAAPKGQDGALVCNMKAKNIRTKDWESLLPKALASAKQFAYDKHEV